MYPLDEFGVEIKVAEAIHISVEEFESRFGEKEEHKFKYDYLFNHENTTPAWKTIFDEWKDQGILK